MTLTAPTINEIQSQANPKVPVKIKNIPLPRHVDIKGNHFLLKSIHAFGNLIQQSKVNKLITIKSIAITGFGVKAVNKGITFTKLLIADNSCKSATAIVIYLRTLDPKKFFFFISCLLAFHPSTFTSTFSSFFFSRFIFKFYYRSIIFFIKRILGFGSRL